VSRVTTADARESRRSGRRRMGSPIADHRPGVTNDGKRPPLETRLLFQRIHGRLDLDLSGKDKDKAGTVLPTVYSRAGEEVEIPKWFRQTVQVITGRFIATDVSIATMSSRRGRKRNSRAPREVSEPDMAEREEGIWCCAAAGRPIISAAIPAIRRLSGRA
jgi:hypothetical protein